MDSGVITHISQNGGKDPHEAFALDTFLLERSMILPFAITLFDEVEFSTFFLSFY